MEYIKARTMNAVMTAQPRDGMVLEANFDPWRDLYSESQMHGSRKGDL